MSIMATFLILFLAGLCLALLVLSRIALYALFHKAGGFLAKYNVEFSRYFVHALIFVMIAVFEVKNYDLRTVFVEKCGFTENLSCFGWEVDKIGVSPNSTFVYEQYVMETVYF